MGYPDWQNFPTWHGQVINAGNVSVTIGSPVTISGPVTNFASIYLGVTSPAAGVTILVTFWDSQALVVQYSIFAATVLNGTNLGVIIPATGGWVTIVVDTSQAGTQTVGLTAEGTNQAPSRPVYLTQENRVATLLGSVAANSTVTVRMPAIMEGEGYIYFRDTTGSGKLNVRIRRLNEAAAEIDDVCGIFGSTVATVAAFKAPPRPLDISIFNTDAGGAHTYDLSCQVVSVAA